MKRIACSHYSDMDDLVINKATEIGLPLIGGTALEVLSNYYKVPGVRKRSDNDLDFLATDAGDIEEFSQWLRTNIDPDKVKVDIYLEDENALTYSMMADGTLVMKPEYLIWSKLTRSDRSQKDIDDIRWLTSIPDLSDEDISSCLDDLGVTTEEFNYLINEIL